MTITMSLYFRMVEAILDLTIFLQFTLHVVLIIAVVIIAVVVLGNRDPANVSAPPQANPLRRNGMDEQRDDEEILPRRPNDGRRGGPINRPNVERRRRRQAVIDARDNAQRHFERAAHQNRARAWAIHAPRRAPRPRIRIVDTMSRREKIQAHKMNARIHYENRYL